LTLCDLEVDTVLARGTILVWLLVLTKTFLVTFGVVRIVLVVLFVETVFLVCVLTCGALLVTGAVLVETDLLTVVTRGEEVRLIA
jgi:hypothetical protein